MFIKGGFHPPVPLTPSGLTGTLYLLGQQEQTPIHTETFKLSYAFWEDRHVIPKARGRQRQKSLRFPFQVGKWLFIEFI